MAERKAWWEILRDQFAARGLLDPESERIQEATQALPSVQRQARGLLSLDPQAESDTALEMGLGSLPGVGQAMALRDLERARRARDPAAGAMAASNFVPFGSIFSRLRRGPMAQMENIVDTRTKVKPQDEDIAQALEPAQTEMPSSPLMSVTERKTAVGRTALKNLHKEKGVEYKDWSFDRGGAHTPAGPNSGSPAFDVTMNGTYPDDFYGVNGLRYYGTGYDVFDSDAYSTLSRLAGRPNARVTVYRAVEKDAKGKINPGDWVTTSRAYAKEHGQNALNNNFKIVKSTVKASDIWTSGDSMLEWGYHPQEFLPEIRWR